MDKSAMYDPKEAVKALTEIIRETKELIEDTSKLTNSFTLQNYGLTVDELKKGLERELRILEQERQEVKAKYEIH